MPQIRENAVVVSGYRELVRAFDHSVAQLGYGLREELKRVGEVVRVDAASRFQHYDARSAKGYRTYVTQTTVNVAQSIQRKTGKHPEYGALQMKKALLPALDAKAGQIQYGFENLLDRIMTANFGL